MQSLTLKKIEKIKHPLFLLKGLDLHFRGQVQAIINDLFQIFFEESKVVLFAIIIGGKNLDVIGRIIKIV